MAMRLADRLRVARQLHFVGRTAEQSLFQSLIEAPDLPFCILYIYGPGGVGKTTLLQTFAGMCTQVNVPITYLDARNVEPAPDAFLRTLSTARGLEPGSSALNLLANQAEREVLLIDTYETLHSLEGWFRDQFLPQLSEQVLVVLAGRTPPAAAWRSDPGWYSQIHVLPLRNLSPDEGRTFLEQRALPLDQHAVILDWTHSHPLALSLVADLFAQRGVLHFRPDDAPDVVKTLLEALVQQVPGPAHRAALEACALVRLMTEPLLGEMLAVSDAHSLFEWLRGLSFIEAGGGGLFPHDLAREALVADVRWRNPDWYRELHRRARSYYGKTARARRGYDQQQVLLDYVFLHRDSGAVRPLFVWQDNGMIRPGLAQPADMPTLHAAVARYEGADSAAIADYWLTRQPHNVTVFRDDTQAIVGLIIMVDLDRTNDVDCAYDPGTAAAVAYLAQHAPLRTGERALMFRFWLATESYQQVGPIQSLIFVRIAQQYLNTAGLAFSCVPCAVPDVWAAGFAYADLQPVPEASFSVGQREYAVYGHDWRVLPMTAWLDRLAERELSAAPQLQPPARNAPLVVLSEPEFLAAVRAALHEITRPTSLRTNPLLNSRLIMEHSLRQSSEAVRVTRLQAVIERAITSLQSTPRDAKLYRAIYHTYLHPAATQERAAELVDVPFSSYRRHLKAGVERVGSLLWQWELDGAET